MNLTGREQFGGLSENLPNGVLNEKLQNLTLKVAKLPPVATKAQTLSLSEVQRELTKLLPEHNRGQNAQLSVILKREAIANMPKTHFVFQSGAQI